MYKVFVNERPFVLSAEPVNIKDCKSVEYADIQQLKTLFAELKQARLSLKAVNVYSPDVASLKKDFFKLFTRIKAAGGIVQNPKGEYLFIKRLGYWDLPKGKIDKGEEREAAAIREVEEECGISGLTITARAANTYHMYEQRGYDILKTTYWYFMDTTFDGQLIPQTEENITEARWMTKEEVATEALSKTYVSIAELIKASILKEA